MPVSLKGAKVSSGVKDRLRGKSLKDHLIDEKIPVIVNGCTMKEGDYGEYWEVLVRFTDADGEQDGVLNFATHPDRDPTMTALQYATTEDVCGPLLLTRNGTQGWQEFVDVE